MEKLQKSIADAEIEKWGTLGKPGGIPTLEKPTVKGVEWQLEAPSAELKLTKKSLSLLDNDLSMTANDFGLALIDLDAAVSTSSANFASEFTRFSTTFADAIVGSMGEAGEVIRAAVQGFQSAGPWGAIAAVAATLLSKTQAFQKLVDMVNQVLYWIVGMFEPVLQGFMPELIS